MIENTQFVPDIVRIPADTPVRLIVDRREDVACSAQIFLPQLDILRDLAPNGVTKVDIPATGAGTYTLTCGMSMMSGQLIVGGESGSGGRPSLAAWLLLAGMGIAGTLWFTRSKVASARVLKSQKPSESSKAAKVDVRILGLEPNQFAIVTIALIVAVIAGLAMGGFFG